MTTTRDPTVKDLLKRNMEIAQNYVSPLLLSEMPKDAQMPKIFIVTCCDNRIDATKLLGLQEWDAIVVRSAAGRVAPHLQNLLFLDQVLGFTFTDIMIIQHTASMMKNSDVRQVLKERAPDQDELIDKLVFPGFNEAGLEESVRHDVELVKGSALFRPELANRTCGFILDIKTGKINPVI